MSKFVDNWMSQRNFNLIMTSKSACSCHASWDILHKQSIYIDYIFNESKQSTIGNQPQKRKPSISQIQKWGTEPVCLYKVDRFLYSFKSWNVRTEIFNLLILNYMHIPNGIVWRRGRCRSGRVFIFHVSARNYKKYVLFV